MILGYLDYPILFFSQVDELALCVALASPFPYRTYLCNIRSQQLYTI
jgi:hypothetical protein